MLWMKVALLSVLAAGLMACSKAPPSSLPNVYQDCPISRPNGQVPPGEDPKWASNVLGNGEIWVGLYPEGTLVFRPSYPGAPEPALGLAEKFWWWRSTSEPLEITGRRIDRDAPPMGAWTGGGYEPYFQASSLIFPTPGCWEVTGRAGGASLTLVTRVVSFY